MQESRVRLLVRKIPWRRIWQPTPVFLLRKSHGQRSLVGCIQSMGQQRVGYNLATQQQFFGRTDAEAEALILWLPDTKSWLSGKDPDAGKDWGQEEKRVTEDEMFGMASLIHWTWTWANSGRRWVTGKPGVLQPMGLQSRTWLGNWTTTAKVKQMELLPPCSRNTKLKINVFFLSSFGLLVPGNTYDIMIGQHLEHTHTKRSIEWEEYEWWLHR